MVEFIFVQGAAFVFMLWANVNGVAKYLLVVSAGIFALQIRPALAKRLIQPGSEPNSMKQALDSTWFNIYLIRVALMPLPFFPYQSESLPISSSKIAREPTALTSIFQRIEKAREREKEGSHAEGMRLPALSKLHGILVPLWPTLPLATM